MTRTIRVPLIVILAILPAMSGAQDDLSAALEARAKAEKADAIDLAAGAWDTAEKQLARSRKASGKGNFDNAREAAVQSRDLYSIAELEAIKHQRLDETAALIAEAVKARADKYAPQSLARAKTLLKRADDALTSDRYDTGKAKTLTTLANDQALQALYITTLARKVRQKELTVEAIILDWEASLKKTAATANITAGPAADHSDTFVFINEVLEQLQSENKRLTDDLGQRILQVAGLEEELRELDERLRNAAGEREQLVMNLQSRARIREQFLQIETMFSDDEATVLRESDTVILRLAGLKFNSGSAELDAASGPLMEKVVSAIRVFPRSDLVVEGHTDSIGSNATNLTLSQERADSVMAYFIDELRIPAHRIRAIGYGDGRPIANNASEQGRARNRRIDIIIVPKLDMLQY